MTFVLIVPRGLGMGVGAYPGLLQGRRRVKTKYIMNSSTYRLTETRTYRGHDGPYMRWKYLRMEINFFQGAATGSLLNGTLKGMNQPKH